MCRRTSTSADFEVSSSHAAKEHFSVLYQLTKDISVSSLDLQIDESIV